MNEADFDSKKEGVVLSGMRPTGELHIGHFEGVLRNWVELQNTHRSFYFVADWHALTTELDTTHLQRHTLDMVKDWLAFGVDPEKSTIFVQSYVPQHAELGLILERLINIGALERMPSFKDQLNHLSTQSTTRDENGQILTGEDAFRRLAKEKVSAGFLNYPVLQSADILLYGATHVPVGEDQLPHIELTRELARTFNRQYGETLVVPEALVGEAKRIRGTDGRKMSKSYKNDINPGMDPAQITSRVKSMVTVRSTLEKKGEPFDCAVYDLQRVFNQEGELRIAQGCRNASIRCYDCKMELPDKISAAYDDYREKRPKIGDDFVKDVLHEGNKRATTVAQRTIERVIEAMKMDYLR